MFSGYPPVSSSLIFLSSQVLFMVRIPIYERVGIESIEHLEQLCDGFATPSIPVLIFNHETYGLVIAIRKSKVRKSTCPMLPHVAPCCPQTGHQTGNISGWWFGTFQTFSISYISYMGCHPSH